MNSAAMEKEGLLRSLSNLASYGLTVTDLVTDQHPAITKMMPEKFPTIRHWYDDWHVVKGDYFVFLPYFQTLFVATSLETLFQAMLS